MSVSSLPEWKQLLLEKKRREEEERERREKEEEEKLSCMPAWKRGIIQRRRAKHEGLGDREKEKDVSLLQEDWPDTNSKSLSQVSLEAIVPVHENPFIRTQSAWKKGRDADAENEPEVNEKEKDRSSPRGQDGEPERGRDIELKIERVQDLNEEWEKERSEERSQGRENENSREVGEDTSPLDPTQSLSSSPVHPNSLAAMSRIYNLETVGSRSGLCLRERTVDVSSVHLVKVKPLISNAQQGDSKAFTGEDKRGVQSIQRQIEQFQLKEKEALKSCSSPKSFLKDRETKGQQSPTGVSRHQVKDDVKTQEKAQEKAEINLNMSPQHVCSSTSPLKQTITINPSRLRSPSPDSSLKPSDCAPTPASSPSSASPVQSPSVSPFPTPSPTLFSIRSASGGQVKRGATITITPRKPTQAQMTPTETEPAKKKYPTVDEIKVIGGYQNLEKSCLVKNRGTPKRVKVCFIEDQLEQVCEYPSEASMLASTPYPHDLGRIERLQGKEEQEEDDEVEEAAIVSKGTRNVAIAVRRV
uniref:Phostensin/Taperin PP1-binding domain-containing protein n=1 Tax=Monopterus albus TaxID=43700 RepID=A0A3Q3JHQ5_MONAL